jgi:hypothetical protein
MKPHIHDYEFTTMLELAKIVLGLTIFIIFCAYVAGAFKGESNGKWVFLDGKQVYCSDAKTPSERFLCFGNEGPGDKAVK